MHAAGFAELVSADDVGVLETQGHARFALKAPQELRVLGLGGRQNLDGHHLAQVMLRLVNPRHSPLAEPVENFVLVEEKIVRVPLGQENGLVFSDVLVGHQPFGKQRQAVGLVLGLAQPALLHGSHFLGSQKAAANQETADVFYGEVHAGNLVVGSNPCRRAPPSHPNNHALSIMSNAGENSR